ncbi:MAG: hypothetical protein AB1556_06440 [Bacillota bacterium]
MGLMELEKFKNMVLELGLPREELVLFGVVCPYCGKNDRIRPLEPPDELAGELAGADLAKYRQLWEALTAGGPEEPGLAVCKFCHNIMAVNSTHDSANPLY